MDYFTELLEKELESYLSPDHVESCRQAYVLAKDAHASQMRRSGEPYISHPVGAAKILAEMRLDINPLWRLCCMMSLKIPISNAKRFCKNLVLKSLL